MGDLPLLTIHHYIYYRKISHSFNVLCVADGFLVQWMQREQRVEDSLRAQVPTKGFRLTSCLL